MLAVIVSQSPISGQLGESNIEVGDDDAHRLLRNEVDGDSDEFSLKDVVTSPVANGVDVAPF